MVREQYEALRPAATAEDSIDMSYEDVRLEYRETQRRTAGSKILSAEEKVAEEYAKNTPVERWQSIAVADTPRALADALWGLGRFRELPGLFDVQTSETLGERSGMSNQLPADFESHAFVGFIGDLATKMIAAGLIEGELGPHSGDSTAMHYDDGSVEGMLDLDQIQLPEGHLDAATLGLSIFSQVFDKGLLIDTGETSFIFTNPLDMAKSLLNPDSAGDFMFFKHQADADLVGGQVWTGDWNESASELIEMIVDVSTEVLRISGPDMQLAPHVQWGGFYRDGQGRLQGTLNMHVLPTKRLVDKENGLLLGSQKEFQKAIYSMDPESLVPQFVLNLLSVAQGETGVVLTEQHREAAKNWYPKFNKLINVISERFGMTPMNVGAALSALSPQTEWDQNINLGIRAAIEYAMGEVDPNTQLQIVNEIRQEAGYAPVTTLNDAQLQQDRWGKARKAFDNESPVTVLRHLKTMSFAHNGLFPEGTAGNSPEGINVITGDVHFMRAIMGFLFNMDAPWMSSTRNIAKNERWESLLGKDLITRAVEEGWITEEEASTETETGNMWSRELTAEEKADKDFGIPVPSEMALRWYNAITKAMVMVSEVLGIKPSEAQALLWLPIQELATKTKGNRTVVWNDSVIRELEGRSAINPSFIDALKELDSELIDPNSSHVDVFGYNKTFGFDAQNGVLIASGSNGIRVYADLRVEGVQDLLRTAIPIAAEPKTMLRKKKPIGVLGKDSETDAQNDSSFKPLRWVSRKARTVKDLGVVAKEMLHTAPASELRTVSDPSVVEGAPDVYSEGNYIVVEVEPKDIKEVRNILTNSSKPFFKTTETPMTVESGGSRSNMPLTKEQIVSGLASKKNDNPLIKNDWVILPDTNPKFIAKIEKQGVLHPQEIYIKSPDGESRRAWIIFGANQTLKGLESFDVFWTQDAQHNVREGTVTPSEEGTQMSANQNGLTFSLPIDGKGVTDFSVNYDTELSTQDSLNAETQSGVRAPTKRTQIIVELGSVADPDMVLSLWHQLNNVDSTQSLSGYFHGELWVDGSMSRASEYVYTNGNERLVQRAGYNPSHPNANFNHYTVWVPNTEASRLSTHHGSFSPNTESHVMNIQRISDDTVLVDGEIHVKGSGALEVNPEKILDSTGDGEMVTEAAFVHDPNMTKTPVLVVGLEGQVAIALQNLMTQFGSLKIPPIFKLKLVNGENKIVKVINDSAEKLKFGSQERKVINEGTLADMTPAEAAAQRIMGDRTDAKGNPISVKETRKKTGDTKHVDPKSAAEVNTVFEAIMFMIRFNVPFKGKWRSIIKDHPLADVLESRFTPSKINLELHHWYDWHHSRRQADELQKKSPAFDTEQQLEDSPELGVFLDGAGRKVNSIDPLDVTKRRKAKAESLDKGRQTIFKEKAKEMVPDMNLFPNATPLLAGYRFEGIELEGLQEIHDEVVVQNIAVLGALSERPGFEGGINSFRGIPGIKWFRDKHNGMVFPGILPLQGMVGIGAGSLQQSFGGAASGFYSTSRPSTTSGFADEYMLDENGKMVDASGIHIDIRNSFMHIDPKRYISGAIALYGNNAKAKTMKALPDSQLESIFKSLVMIHEYGHAVHGAISELGRGHIFREALGRIVYRHGGPATVFREVSRYAASSYIEFVAESFFTVMAIGPKAHPMAIETVEVMHDLLYTTDTRRLERKYEVSERDLVGGIDAPSGTFEKSHHLGGPANYHPFWTGAISEWETEFATEDPSVQLTFPKEERISDRDSHRSSLFHYLHWLGKTQSSLGRKRKSDTGGGVLLTKEDWAAIK